MSSKGWLVAKREFDENVRTKAFWIGILSVPIILVLVMFLPRLLEKTKDVRKYAVIDHSGWLLGEVEKRAEYDDLAQFSRFLRDKADQGEGGIQELPEALHEQARSLKGASDEAIDAQAKWAKLGQAMFFGKKDESAGAEDSDGDSIDEEFILSDEQQRAMVEVGVYMATLDKEDARKLGARIRSADYDRIEIPAEAEDPEEWCREQLAKDDKSLFAYFVIEEDPVGEPGLSQRERRRRDREREEQGIEGSKYVSNNQTDEGLKNWFSRLATDVVTKRRFDQEKIDPDVARRIQNPVVFEQKQLSSTGEESEVKDEDILHQWAPVGFVYILWISVFTIVQMLLTNTVEEKSNRIIEVLLSSVSPLQLMIGKVFGIAMTGLTMIGSWVIFFYFAVQYAPELMGATGDVPDLSVLITDPVYLLSFVLYFLLGYLLYAAILVGIGSVCNSLKEAQNMMQPIVILLILPLVAMVPVGRDPNGTLAVILSFIPPFTPFVMMNRAAGPPELWEYVATTILLVASILAAFWGAAKIFRIGILMTGKPPKIRDMIQWMKAPVGTVPEVEE